MNNKIVHMVAFVLLVIGGVNWLLIGSFEFNLVETILPVGIVTKVVYILVGLSAVYEAVTHKGRCTACSS